jgi:YVTN family beta-propeller protein
MIRTQRMVRAVALAGVLVPGLLWAQAPRPALVVLSKDAGELEIIDPGSGNIVGKVATGALPHEVAVSTDGRLALATNYGAKQAGTSLSLIDLEALKEIQRVTLLDVLGPQGEKFGDLIGPHGVAFFDGKFYFTAEGAKKIARYDPAKNRIDWAHDIGENRTHMLVIAPDGKRIYTSNVNSGTVTVVQSNADGSSWTNTVIPVGKGPEGIDLSPDGKEVWAANSEDGTVSVIDTASKKMIATLDVGTKHSNRVKFTLDGKLALISDIGNGDLLIVNVASRKIVKRMKLGPNAEGVLMRPDGAVAYVAVSAEDHLAVVDLKTFEVIGTIATGKDPDGMAWRK